jgi:hypothetical protein
MWGSGGSGGGTRTPDTRIMIGEHENKLFKNNVLYWLIFSVLQTALRV